LRFLQLTLLLIAQTISISVNAAVPSDTLLHIVQQCVDPSTQNYCAQCRLPQKSAECLTAPTCRSTVEIWAEDKDFVAMRDIKMCGCPEDFVHGLVLPKATITGVEDPNKPDSIWLFAWRIAILRMSAEDIALVVNPRLRRTQNQLHVHLVRLKPESRSKFGMQMVGKTSDVSSVWHIAQRAAGERKMDDFGVLVFQTAANKFGVVISGDSPEGLYTHAVCRPEAGLR
jgi:CDP-diacylglycerol pyrophosphatase